MVIWIALQRFTNVRARMVGADPLMDVTFRPLSLKE
jgi:hypothetical protein